VRFFAFLLPKPKDYCFTMKRILILLSIISTSFAMRADLVIQEQAVEPHATNDLIIKFHGDKMLNEQLDATSGDFILISDLATRDSISLSPKQKTYMKQWGTNEPNIEVALKKAFGETNVIFADPAKPLDTGKTEKVGDYETEIYSWFGPNGMVQKFWVAKDFPNYAAIKTDRDKMYQWNSFSATKGSQPDLRQLPGMVVKTQIDITGRSITVSLISAKVEPVDPSEFELPADYTEWKPPVFHPLTITMTNSIK
jgi:hypothetical protein